MTLRRVSLPPARAAPLAGLLLAVAACSGGAPDEAPADLLRRAQETLDATSAVTVQLSGEGLPDTGTVLVGADGVAAHPASFEGDLRISQDGIPVTVPLVSVDGEVWATLPFTSEFTAIDPADYGVGDPGRLIDPEAGVSGLLVADPSPEDAGEVRLGDEVLREVTAELPGDLVDDVLALADPAATVPARFAVEPESGELRRAVLTGPFYAGGAQTYTLLLDGYGTTADIRAPTG
jgi:lipoprotein LprG